MFAKSKFDIDDYLKSILSSDSQVDIDCETYISKSIYFRTNPFNDRRWIQGVDT